MFFVPDKKLKIDKPIRLIELFAGVGAQAKALENINANFEHYVVCEFDEKAVQSYNAVHHTKFTTSDITQIHAHDLNIVDTDNYVYLLTYSFPCTDISTAGRGLGMSENSGTRSSLLWEVRRLLQECDKLPQILLMENVTQVHLGKNREHFSKWCQFLQSLGYKNYVGDLCSSDYDIPQTRLRTFMISVLGDFLYEFPSKMNLTKSFLDLLEENVNIKYYVMSDFGKHVVNRFLYGQHLMKYSNYDSDVHPISTYIHIPQSDIDFAVKKCGVFCGNISQDQRVSETDENITRQRLSLKSKQILGTLTTVSKDNVIFEVYEISSEMSEKAKVYFTDCIYECDDRKYLCLIRYLTPKECFRFMGFSDIDFENISSLNLGDRYLYKQSGNSIVVNVLMEIFRKMI